MYKTALLTLCFIVDCSFCQELYRINQYDSMVKVSKFNFEAKTFEFTKQIDVNSYNLSLRPSLRAYDAMVIDVAVDTTFYAGMSVFEISTSRTAIISPSLVRIYRTKLPTSHALTVDSIFIYRTRDGVYINDRKANLSYTGSPFVWFFDGETCFLAERTDRLLYVYQYNRSDKLFEIKAEVDPSKKFLRLDKDYVLVNGGAGIVIIPAFAYDDVGDRPAVVSKIGDHILLSVSMTADSTKQLYYKNGKKVVECVETNKSGQRLLCGDSLQCEVRLNEGLLRVMESGREIYREESNQATYLVQ